jgi:TPR repeat protein
MTDYGSISLVALGIDSEFPWKLTQRDFDWTYGYKMSVSEWRALLARAKRGDPEAEWGVADRYGDGCKDNRGRILVRRSARKAAQWFRRAAEHGCAPAQNTLGVLLSNGDGVTKNVKEALLWLRRAFRAGDASVANNLAITYREIGNLRTAVRWFRKAADGGDDDALLQLGIHYYWGKGVKRNQQAAIRCFRRATKGKFISGYGRDDAFFCLGLGYFEGKGVERSLGTARKLFQRANTDNDHPAARQMLRQLRGPTGDITSR